MSNESLRLRIEQALLSAKEAELTGSALADVIRGNGRAMEGMAYPAVTEMESLAMDLEIATWEEDEHLLSNVG
ncbi:MAG: hypothetical protein ABWY09_09345 [Stenotrophomonas maltophilia]